MLADNVHEIGLVSVLYVSRSLIEEDSAQRLVGSIVDQAIVRNATLNVTGALIYTGAHFAQILEGPKTSVLRLMESIENDPRHKDVTIQLSTQLQRRSLPDWAMAYCGPSPYLDRHIKPLLSPLPAPELKSELTERLLEVLRLTRPTRTQGAA